MQKPNNLQEIFLTQVRRDRRPVTMFLMNGFGYEAAVRTHHETSKLCVNLNIAHSCRCQHFFIHTSYAFSDHTDVIWLLIRVVRDADTTG